MIDRLEMFTSLNMRDLERRHKLGRPFTSKLIEEDEHIKEFKWNDTGTLYKNLFIETFRGDARTGDMYDDPVSFYIFASPRFRSNKTHEFKIVCNPSRITIGMLLDFLYKNFVDENFKTERLFSQQFRLGRVDFAVDVPDYSVDELRRMIYVANKTRKHTSIFSVADDGAGFLRIISAKEPETFYVGKGDVVLRVYNKVLETKHQIAVFKREGRPVPERLQQTAALPQLTRIELQFRSLGKSGYRNDNGKEIFSPSRGFHMLRTFNDILHITKSNVDVFDDVLFDPTYTVDYFQQDYMNRAFSALIAAVGLDEALKQLPPDKRREIRSSIQQKKFHHNLNQSLYREIMEWTRN